MPRDFKSFSKDNYKKTNFSNNEQQKVNEYQDIISKYKDMNSTELMSNLFSEATKLKQQGKLDANTLNNLKSTLTPFLNNEQQGMLNSLINAINEQK